MTQAMTITQPRITFEAKNAEDKKTNTYTSLNELHPPIATGISSRRLSLSSLAKEEKSPLENIISGVPLDG